jgi:uncharacterized protein YbjQ (UPF0145 family)
MGSIILHEFKSILGGGNNLYTEMCKQTRESAYNKMLENAKNLGADTIVGLKFDSSEIGGEQMKANEVFRYGTAVVIERK